MATTSWRSFSAQTQVCQYAYLALLRALHHSTPPAWNLAGRAWLACLFRPRTLVRDVLSGLAYLVVDCLGACAVLVWLVEEHYDEGLEVRYFTIGEGNIVNSQPHWLVPLEIPIYEVIPTISVSPLHLWLKLQKECPSSMGVVFLETGPPIDMWTNAAKAAFWTMSMPQIKQFSDFHGLTQPVPELMAMLRRLIRKIIPDEDDEAIDEALEKRCHIDPDPIEDIVDAEVLDTLLSPDEAQHVQVLFERDDILRSLRNTISNDYRMFSISVDVCLFFGLCRSTGRRLRPRTSKPPRTARPAPPRRIRTLRSSLPCPLPLPTQLLHLPHRRRHGRRL